MRVTRCYRPFRGHGIADHHDSAADFNMPGATGLEIARSIHNTLPDLPVIMVSGYITDALREQAESAGVRQLIAKPQDLEELRDAVQSIFFPFTKTSDRNQP